MTKLSQKLMSTRLGAIALGVVVAGASSDALAGGFNTATTSKGNTFANTTANLTGSLQNIPGLISAMCYIVGLAFALLGVLKIKDHVENPTQTPLKDGAIRLVVGGSLLALPMLTEVMTTAFGNKGTTAGVSKVDNVGLGSMLNP